MDENTHIKNIYGINFENCHFEQSTFQTVVSAPEARFDTQEGGSPAETVEGEEVPAAPKPAGKKRCGTPGAPVQTFENVVSDASMAEKYKAIIQRTLEGKARKEAFCVIKAALLLKWLTDYPAYPVLKREFDIGFSETSYSSYRRDGTDTTKVQHLMRTMREALNTPAV